MLHWWQESTYDRAKPQSYPRLARKRQRHICRICGRKGYTLLPPQKPFEVLSKSSFTCEAHG